MEADPINLEVEAAVEIEEGGLRGLEVEGDTALVGVHGDPTDLVGVDPADEGDPVDVDVEGNPEGVTEDSDPTDLEVEGDPTDLEVDVQMEEDPTGLQVQDDPASEKAG